MLAISPSHISSKIFPRSTTSRLILIAYFSLGLGGTSALLALVVGGRIFSLSAIATLIVFTDLIIGKKNKKTSLWRLHTSRYFIIWMGISILSSFWGFAYFSIVDINFAVAPLTFIPKIGIYLLLLYFLSIRENSEIRISFLIKGIIFGVWFNILWSICDAAMYYTIGRSLTNTVFHPYIVAADIRYGTASLEFGSYIRSSGLNTDPANIGFFAAVGTAYAMVGRKFWLIGACVLSALSAVSFVGLVGIALVIVYELLFGKAIRHSALFLIIGAIITISAYTYYKHSSQPLITFLRDAIELKAQSKADGDQSTELRSNFIKKFPDAVSHLPSSLIIGTGYYTGVYAYYLEGVTYYGEFSGRNVPTEMENCYIEYFFDFGLIGFFFFCLFYLQILLNYQKIDRIHPSKTNKSIFAIILGSIISFCFYHYTLYSVIMFTDVAAIVHLRNIYRKRKYSKQFKASDTITKSSSEMPKNHNISQPLNICKQSS